MTDTSKATKCVTINMADAMEEMTPEMIEAMAPILLNPMIKALELQLEHAAAELIAARKRIAELVSVLSELKATVEGECPSILNGDSGGNDRLAFDIDNALEPTP